VLSNLVDFALAFLVQADDGLLQDLADGSDLWSTALASGIRHRAGRGLWLNGIERRIP
jgi:hypothetical protein